MAQAAAEVYASKKNLTASFDSAGVAVSPSSQFVNPNSAKALFNAYGIRFSHKPQQLTRDLSEKFDIIVAMNDDIAAFARNVIGIDEKKLIVMSKRIPDPFGYSQEIYNECLKEIANGVTELIDSVISEEDREEVK